MIEGIFFLVLMIFVLCYPPAALATASYKSCMRRKKLSISENIRCAIPLLNIATIRTAFYGSATFVYVMLIPICIGALIRLLAITLLYDNAWFVLISVPVALLVIALIWILCAYTFYDVANMVRMGILTKLFCFIVPPLGAFIVSKAVGPYMKSVKEEIDDTFGGQNQ